MKQIILLRENFGEIYRTENSPPTDPSMYVCVWTGIYIHIHNVNTDLYVMSIMKKNMPWILQGMGGDMGGNRERGMGINYMNTVSMHAILRKRLKIVKRNALSSYDCFQTSGLLGSGHTWHHHLHPSQDPCVTLLVSPRPYVLTPVSAATDLWIWGLSYSGRFPRMERGLLLWLSMFSLDSKPSFLG